MSMETSVRGIAGSENVSLSEQLVISFRENKQTKHTSDDLGQEIPLIS